MKTNRFLLFVALSLTALTVSAQTALQTSHSDLASEKIDARLTNLVKKSAPALAKRAGTRSTASLEAYQKKVKETHVVNFNADGSVRTLGVTAYLRQGVECPTTQLEAIGIRHGSPHSDEGRQGRSRGRR